MKIKISYTCTTFNWVNEIKRVAAAHCVIVSIIYESQEALNYLYYDDVNYKKVTSINTYLTEGINIFVISRNKPLCKVLDLKFGSMPRDGGNFILIDEDIDEFIREYPQTIFWIKPYIGAREFINRTNRWGL